MYIVLLKQGISHSAQQSAWLISLIWLFVFKWLGDNAVSKHYNFVNIIFIKRSVTNWLLNIFIEKWFSFYIRLREWLINWRNSEGIINTCSFYLQTKLLNSKQFILPFPSSQLLPIRKLYPNAILMHLSSSVQCPNRDFLVND